MKTQKSSLEFSHFPVMLNEVTQISLANKGGLFVDCTFGGGNYSTALLKFPKTRVIAFDRDSTVAPIAENLKKKFQKRFEFHQIRFSQLDKVLINDADAFIFDLGLSSFQLKNLKRGFSFKSKDKIDMTMGLSDISAQEVINNLSETDLKLIIKILGEEKDASRIAKNIVKTRSIKKITKVDQLVEIIEKSKKKNFLSKINPSTKTFQALRIFVNKEISELINGITYATKFLRPGGRLIVISFHSIEDKIIKYYFSNFSKNRSNPSRYLPEDGENEFFLFESYNKKVFKPSRNEIIKNKPSRSAKLRFAIRSKKGFSYPSNLFQKFEKYLNIEAKNV